ncbi:MAG: adenylate/guanylate cyclase domain-containing protein [Actinomycetota bacterium]
MAGAETRNLDQPDESMEFDHGRTASVHMGDVTVGRQVLEPGWRWSTHIRPIVGTERCASSHVGIQLSGRMHVVLQTGEESEVGPGDVYIIPPGHDAWVVGDEPVVAIEWSGVRGWLDPMESRRSRLLATLVFTDIVDSTATASRIGDARWGDLLGRHNVRVRELLARYGGREVKTTGDGFLVMFDGAERAVRFAAAVNASSAADGLVTRAGVHTGEVEFVKDDLQGVAVHEAARIVDLAGPGETMTSALTRELVSGAGFRFEDRGEHDLKGIEGPRRVFALATAER